MRSRDSRRRALNRWLCSLMASALVAMPALACPPLEKENSEQSASRSSPVQADALASSATSRAAQQEQAAPAPVPEPPTQSLSELLDRDDLSSFVNAARRADLQSALPEDGPITIFVPNNDAFEALTEATKIALRSERNLPNLQTILAHHVAGGAHRAEDLIGTPSLQVLSGQSVEIDASYGGITVGRGEVIEADLAGGRAIVHIVDQVLIPEGITLYPDGNLLLGVYVRRPDSGVAESLDMRRSELLLVSSVIEGTNAESSGVLGGDIIYRIDDRPASVDAGEQAKKEKGIGNDVELRIVRDGERIVIMVPVGVEPR